MEYQTFEPSDELVALVKCYWTLIGRKEEIPERQTIVPDGCMEMIFHCGDLYRQYTENGNSVIQPRCFVIGQLTRPLEIEPTGETAIFSVRFHHGGFLPFSTMSLKELENTAVPLDRLFGNAGSTIEKEILNAESSEDRVQKVELFLKSRLTDREFIDRVVKSTVESILTANGQLSVEELSKQNNTNRRQLERKFLSTVGLSPKQLSKTIRLQATLTMMLNRQFGSLTDVAYENDYYDQAHFIKDFKEFTGRTPKEFYSNQLKLSALFYG